jgi:hypothetical protein
MNPQSTLRSRIARLATLAAATAISASALALGASTSAHAWTGDVIWLESDTVVLKDPATGSPGFNGKGSTFFDRGYIGVHVSGVFQRATTTPGCRAVRVVFTYADESTSSQTSPRLCKEFNTFRSDPYFLSRSDRHVVRFATQLLGASDSTAPLTVLATNRQYVGDAPDSLGSASRLDHDTNVVDMTGWGGSRATMFQGSTDYFLQRHEVAAADFVWWTPRARVAGTLTWSDIANGSEAYLSVQWTYGDGTTAWSNSERITRGVQPTRTISLTSSSSKNVVAVKMHITTNATGTYGVSTTSVGHLLDPSSGGQ